MSVQVEKLEKSMAKLTITVEAAKFDAAVVQLIRKIKVRLLCRDSVKERLQEQ